MTISARATTSASGASAISTPTDSKLYLAYVTERYSENPHRYLRVCVCVCVCVCVFEIYVIELVLTQTPSQEYKRTTSTSIIQIIVGIKMNWSSGTPSFQPAHRSHLAELGMLSSRHPRAHKDLGGVEISDEVFCNMKVHLMIFCPHVCFSDTSISGQCVCVCVSV